MDTEGVCTLGGYCLGTGNTSYKSEWLGFVSGC